MSERQFKYDIAISFLTIPDEPLAVAMANGLADRAKCFVYSERQTDLVGKNGMEELTRVFKSEARLVVVLYRKGWGENPWTKAEKVAILDRKLNDATDFYVVVKLDDSPIPDWASQTQIWGDGRKYSVDELDAIFESRLRDLGGALRPQTVEDRAMLANRAMAFARRRKEFLESTGAVEPADKEADRLLRELVSLSGTIASRNSELRMVGKLKEVPPFERRAEIESHPLQMDVIWFRAYQNTLLGSLLVVQLLKANSPYGSFPERDHLIMSKIEYKFTQNESEQFGWIEWHGKGSFIDTSTLAVQCMDTLIREIQAIRMSELK